MLLIGMLDSPFVRRVAVSMRRLGLSYEHGNWSVGRDFERIRQYNPLVKVPTLVLDDGEVLSESSAILDYLDDLAGPARALLPPTGAPRRQALQLMVLATGACEHARDLLYEQSMRPPEKQHEPWSTRRRTQMQGAVAELEKRVGRLAGQPWLLGDALTQADITVGCAFAFLVDTGCIAAPTAYPALQQHSRRCEQLPEFQATFTPFLAPSPASGGATPPR